MVFFSKGPKCKEAAVFASLDVAGRQQEAQEQGRVPTGGEAFGAYRRFFTTVVSALG